MILRVRWQEIAMLPVALVLAFNAVLPDWFTAAGVGRSGLQSGLAGWLCLLVAVVAVVAVLQAAFRRSATGSLADEVAVLFLAPISILLIAVAIAWPDPFAGAGLSAAPPAFVALALMGLMFLLDVDGQHLVGLKALT